jgi:hypothetical protein
MREAARIGEAVKAASAKKILGLADQMLGAAGPEAATKSCCGGGDARQSYKQTESSDCC